MFTIIRDLFRSSIKSHIAFKGGTLCMFLFELDRFSVDIDLDVTDTKIPLEEIKKTIYQITINYGTIKKETGTKVLLKYDKDNIPLKIEYNTRISQYDRYEIKNFFGDPVRTMHPDCMFANKLVAVTQRKERRNNIAPRDLYDVWFFFEHNWNIEQDIIKERTGKSLETYLNYLKSFIPKNFNEENILRGLGDLVTEKQKYFIKHKLIAEVLNQIDFYLWNINKT